MVIYSRLELLGNRDISRALFGILAILAFPVFLLYPYSLDDLQAFSAIQSRSYHDLALGSHGWGGTVFYRPLIDLQTKLIWDVFAGSFFAFKLYQFLLFIVFLLILNNLVGQLRLNLLGTALLLVMVMSSRAIHDAFLWWVNMGQAMVLLCFALLLYFLLARQSYSAAHIAKSGTMVAFIYAGLSFLAIFSKEVGLVVLIGFAYLAYSERNRLAAVLLFLVFAAFVLARIYVIGGIEAQDPFMASSGLGFSFLSSEELRDAFGGNKYFYYLYNVTAQFLYVLFRQPVDGQFMSYSFGLRGLTTAVYAVSSGYLLMLLLVRKVSLSEKIVAVLLGAIAINSLLSFPYSRERIMVAADLASSLLFALIASSLCVTKSDAAKRPRTFEFLNLSVVASVLVLTISLIRALRRYFVDISSSLEAMHQFVSKDYQLLTETQGPLPSTVIEGVINNIDAHYNLILGLMKITP
jgi:hypothetical protein